MGWFRISPADLTTPETFTYFGIPIGRAEFGTVFDDKMAASNA